MFGFRFWMAVFLFTTVSGWLGIKAYQIYNKGFDKCVTQVNKGTQDFENEANKIIKQPLSVDDAISSLRRRQGRSR
jgi:hypothetical protein